MSKNFYERVRSATDLVALIGVGVILYPRQTEFVARCPFHESKDPSMTVSPTRQTFKCRECNAGGDCFSWVMEIEELTFREALARLADRAGLRE